MRFFWALLLAVGCSSSELKESTGCDPLDKALCALPFPSSYFLEESSVSATGYQVAFGEESLPINIDGVRIKPQYWNEKDGFSTLTPILAFFPDVDESLLMTHADLDQYLSEGVATVLLNAQTGERVPHFTELDYAYLDEIIVEEPANTLLHIYPVVPLDFSTRYIVAYRGLSNSQGESFAPSAAFEALRDGVETDQADVEDRPRDAVPVAPRGADPGEGSAARHN